MLLCLIQVMRDSVPIVFAFSKLFWESEKVGNKTPSSFFNGQCAFGRIVSIRKDVESLYERIAPMHIG
nr:MAG TPA: hypothetical protein [Caudoviricetes sp.]